ncbi:hypothetical protein ACB092_05G229800 [Castanea dentata]
MSLMGSIFICRSNLSENRPPSTCSFFFLVILLVQLPFLSLTTAQASHCRTTCGDIPIKYPFGIDDGCGSPYYRYILIPSSNVSYSERHILLTDPFMWNCQDTDRFRPTRPFSLDTSTHFSLSPQNEYLFFNCSEDDCPSALSGSTSCCSYYPKATESLRLMLKYCASYTSVYWKDIGSPQPYDQVPEYGIRVDFDIPVTTRCLQCQDRVKGGGTCGFDTQTQNFLCLCEERNITTYCQGTVTAVSAAGGLRSCRWSMVLEEVRAKAPVTCGVQSNENRLF